MQVMSALTQSVGAQIVSKLELGLSPELTVKAIVIRASYPVPLNVVILVETTRLQASLSVQSSWPVLHWIL